MATISGPEPVTYTLHNLPTPTTRFIGRDREIADFAALLATAECRLLTLVGPGGIGKTRLAIETARHSVPHFPHGVYFVPLAPLAEPYEIISAIIEAVPLQIHECKRDPFEDLLDYLSEKQMLLVLDNFEQLLPAAEKINIILDFAPQVTILVTSRVALNLREEWVRSLAGMTIPANDNQPTDVEAFSAVALFLERAQRLGSATTTQADLPAIVRICQLVEGNPLAIELAAGWLNTLPPAAIVAEIERGIDILVTRSRDIVDRHRSMRAVFDHSWHMLAQAEQAVFQRLSVFRGGFDRDAAQHVAGASLPILAELVDKSLVTLGSSGRYTIHELLRQYGEEQLKRGSDAGATYTAYTEYYLGILGRLEQAVKGGGQIAALDTIDADFENVRSAWHRAIKMGRFDLLGLAQESLNFFSDMRARYADGHQLFEQAISHIQATAPDDHPLLLAQLQMRQLRIILMGGLVNDFDIPDRIAACAATAEAHHSLPDLGYATYIKGIVALTATAGNPAETGKRVIPLFEEALHYYEQVGDLYYVAEALVWIGNWQLWHEGLDEGLATLHRGLEMRQEIRDPNGIAWALFNLAEAMLLLNDVPQAEAYNTRAYHAMNEIGTIKGIVMSGFKLSALLAMQGRLEDAQQVMQQIEVITRNSYLDGELHVAGIQACITGLLTEDYELARQLAEQSKTIPQRPFHSYKDTWAFWGMSIAACGQGDVETIRQNYRTMLTYWGQGYHDLATSVLCLGTEAIALAEEGHYREAAELLGLVYQQPPEMWGWMRNWSLVDRLHETLQDRLGRAAYDAALERGAQRDPEAEVRRLLRLEGTDARETANAALPDPLTDREMEVLLLVADGLSNRAIADELVISEGTVKVHARHIYNKLGVSSRTQAIARAGELHLL